MHASPAATYALSAPQTTSQETPQHVLPSIACFRLLIRNKFVLDQDTHMLQQLLRLALADAADGGHGVAGVAAVAHAREARLRQSRRRRLPLCGAWYSGEWTW